MAEPNLTPRSAGSSSVGTIAKPYNEMRASTAIFPTICSRQTSGAALSGHRAVVMDSDGEILYANSANTAHAGLVLGITTNAVNAHLPIDIIVSGEVIEPTWSWEEKKIIFLNGLGTLSQTPPDTGFICVMGFAVTATKMIVSVHSPILLS